MAWFWTDDLARALIESGLASATEVADWIARPVAIAGADGVDVVDLAAEAFGRSAGAA